MARRDRIPMEVGKSAVVGIFAAMVGSQMIGDPSWVRIGIFVIFGFIVVTIVAVVLEWADDFLYGEHPVKGDEMPRLTITLTDEQAELVEQLSGEGGPYESKSEAVRNLIQAGEETDELEAEISRLRDRLEQREDRVDELEKQLARRSQVEEKVDTLAKHVEEREMVMQAPFFVRWYRWFRR